jgi:hypothetical protein
MVWRRRKRQDDSLVEALLARCQGFAVDTHAGRVGVVEEVVWGGSRRWDRPEGIAVSTGPEGKRRIIVPAGEVEQVLPAERRVVVRQSALG